MCVLGEKRRESDTEGYCCISSLSSCLGSENRRRRVMSGLLSSTSLSLLTLAASPLSFFSLSLFLFLQLLSLTPFYYPLSLLLFIGLFMERSDVEQLGSKLENEACMLMSVGMHVCVYVVHTQSVYICLCVCVSVSLPEGMRLHCLILYFHAVRCVYP